MRQIPIRSTLGLSRTESTFSSTNCTSRLECVSVARAVLLLPDADYRGRGYVDEIRWIYRVLVGPLVLAFRHQTGFQ